MYMCYLQCNEVATHFFAWYLLVHYVFLWSFFYFVLVVHLSFVPLFLFLSRVQDH